MVTTAGAAVRRFLGELIRSAYHPRREMRAFRHFRSSSSPGGVHEAIAVPGPLHPVDVHGARSFEDLDHRVALPAYTQWTAAQGDASDGKKRKPVRPARDHS